MNLFIDSNGNRLYLQWFTYSKMGNRQYWIRHSGIRCNFLSDYFHSKILSHHMRTFIYFHRCDKVLIELWNVGFHNAIESAMYWNLEEQNTSLIKRENFRQNEGTFIIRQNFFKWPVLSYWMLMTDGFLIFFPISFQCLTSIFQKYRLIVWHIPN